MYSVLVHSQRAHDQHTHEDMFVCVQVIPSFQLFLYFYKPNPRKDPTRFDRFVDYWEEI